MFLAAVGIFALHQALNQCLTVKDYLQTNVPGESREGMLCNKPQIEIMLLTVPDSFLEILGELLLIYDNLVEFYPQRLSCTVSDRCVLN